MTLTIDLPPNMEEQMKREAERRGIEPTQLVIEAVDALLSKPANGHVAGKRQTIHIPNPTEPIGVKTIDEHFRKRREAGLEELPFYETATPDEQIQALHEWADGHKDWPVLSPEADSREFMYEERMRRILGMESTEE